MESFITSYIIQKRECHLPRLGNFSIRRIPALLDVASKKIFPVTDEIIFDENESELSEGLIHYLAHLLHISVLEAEQEITSWCARAKMKIDSGEKIELATMGHLQKNDAGNLVFQKAIALSLFPPIAAERVVHKNTEHPVLVGDKETTSGVMNEFFREDTTVDKRSSWKIRALILLAIAILLLILFYSTHSFTIAAAGNKSLFRPLTPPASSRCFPTFIS